MRKLIDYFWPFQQRSAGIHPSASWYGRLRTTAGGRKPSMLLPFVRRWAFVSALLGLLLKTMNPQPGTSDFLLLSVVISVVWIIAIVMVVFMLWIYITLPD